MLPNYLANGWSPFARLKQKLASMQSGQTGTISIRDAKYPYRHSLREGKPRDQKLELTFGI
jgi:hypothetical protein